MKMLQLLARLLVIGHNIISRIGIGCTADVFSRNKQLSMFNMLREQIAEAIALYKEKKK